MPISSLTTRAAKPTRNGVPRFWPRARPAVTAFSVVFFVGLFGASDIQAQDSTHPAVTHVDQVIEDLFSRATRLENQGAYDQAAQQYLKAQDLILQRRRKNPEKRTVTPVDEALDWGIERAIAQRIRNLPKDGLKAYLLVAEPRAKAALVVARKTRDWSQLQSIVDRFPETKGGLEALSLLADMCLEQGQLKQAFEHYLKAADRYAQSPKTFKDQAHANFWAAARVAQLEGRSFAVQRVIDRARERQLKDCAQALSAWQAKNGAKADNKADNKADSKAGPKAEQAATLADIGLLEKTLDLPEPEMPDYIAQRSSAPRSYHGVVVDPKLKEFFVTDSKTVRCFRYIGHPRLQWQYTVATKGSEPERLEVLQLKPALARDRVVVSLNRNIPSKWQRRKAQAKDNKGAGAEKPKDNGEDDSDDDPDGDPDGDKPEDDDSKNDPDAKPKPKQEEKNRDPDNEFEVERAQNWRVIALNRNTGKVIWDSIKNDKFDDYSRNAEWMSAPVIDGQSLFVSVTVVENALHSYLLKISLEDGSIEWIADLGSRSPENHRGLVGPLPQPLVVRGQVYVASSMGLFFKVDGESGRVRWAYHYPVFPIRSQSTVVDEHRRFLVTPIYEIEDAGLVVLAPVDGPYLMAFNQQTGALAWQCERGDARTVQALDQGELLLIGRSVVVLDGRTGLVLRFRDLQEPILAPPLVGSNQWILPQSQGFLHLHPKTLQTAVMTKVSDSRSVGVLAALDRGRTLSISPAKIQVFASAERVRKQWSNPGEFESYLKTAELFVQRSQWPQAEQAVVKALKTNTGRKSVAPRLQALMLHLKVLSQKFFKSAPKDGTRLVQTRAILEQIEAAEQVFERSGSLNTSNELVELAQLKRRLGDAWSLSKWRDAPDVAVRCYQSLLNHPRSLQLAYESEASVDEEPATQITINSYAYAVIRLKQLMATHGAEVYQRYAKQARELAQKARKDRSREDMLDIIRRFPVSDSAAGLRLELASFYKARSLHSSASEQYELFLKEHPKEARVPEVLARLAETYHQRNRDMDARRALELLALNHPEAKIPTRGSKTVPALSYVRAFSRKLSRISEPWARARARETMGLEKPIRLSFRTQLDLSGNSPELVTTGPYGQHFGQFFLRKEGHLEAHWIEGGILNWTYGPLDPITADRAVWSQRDRLIVPQRNEVMALNVRTGELLWSKEFKPKAKAGPVFDSIQHVKVDEQRVFVLLENSELIALAGKTGKVLWRAKDPSPLAGSLAVADGLVVLPFNRPAGLSLIDAKTGKAQKRCFLSKSLRSEHRAVPVLAKDTALAQIGVMEVVACDIQTGQLLWHKKEPNLGSIRDLVVSQDEGLVAVLGAQNPGSLLAFRVLSLRTGQTRWSDDGRGHLGAFNANGSVSKIQKLVFGDNVLFSIRTSRLQSNEIWSQDLQTGKRNWAWQAPRRQIPYDVVEAAGQLFVPYGGSLYGSSLSVIAKGSGRTVGNHRVPGRRIFSAGAVAGSLVVVSDKGYFGFSRHDSEQLAQEIVELLQAMQAPAQAKDPLLKALLADRLQRADRLKPAVKVLAQALLSESLKPDAYRRLWSQLTALLEAQIERQRPKMKIRKLTKPASIDGELNDWWREWSSVELSGPVHVLPIQPKAGEKIGLWKGQEDLSARLYMAYDKHNFYFALDVRDTDLRPYDADSDDWIGDCLLICIDTMNDGSSSYNRDDILLSLALTKPRKKGKKKDPQGQPQKKRRRPEGKYFVKRKEDNSGAIYECKVPWSMFKDKGADLREGKGPPKGFTFGFNIVLTDDDGDRGQKGKARGAVKMLSWTPSLRLHTLKNRLWQGFIPKYFGKITLD